MPWLTVVYLGHQADEGKPVVADLQCQPVWLRNHSGDTPLSVSVGSFQGGLTEKGDSPRMLVAPSPGCHSTEYKERRPAKHKPHFDRNCVIS